MTPDIPHYTQSVIGTEDAPMYGSLSDGTTIISVKYDGGIMLAADGRSANSMFVANGCSDKLEPVHDRIYCQRSGTTAHTSTIAKMVRQYVDIQATEMGCLPPVKSAANIMR